MIAVYGPACQRLKYPSDSEQWRSCILTMDTKNAIERYRTSPTTTTSFGHRGFFNCSTIQTVWPASQARDRSIA